MLHHDLPLVVAARLADLPRSLVVPPDVAIGECAGCGARIVLAPSGREMVEAKVVQPACSPCAAAWAAESKGIVVPIMTSGQAEDMRRYERAAAKAEAERN